MKQIIAKCALQARGGNMFRRVLCAILAFLLVVNSAYAGWGRRSRKSKVVCEKISSEPSSSEEVFNLIPCVAAVDDDSSTAVSPIACPDEDVAVSSSAVSPIACPDEDVAVSSPEVATIARNVGDVASATEGALSPVVSASSTEVATIARNGGDVASATEGALLPEDDDIPSIDDEIIPEICESSDDIDADFEEDEDGNILTADTIADEDNSSLANSSAIATKAAAKITAKTAAAVAKAEETLTADSVAVEDETAEEKQKNSKNQIIRYAKRFWDEAEEKYDEYNVDISGTKTFEFKKAKVSGDVSQFSTEHTDCYPGFKMEQSLHLEVDGNLGKNSTVHAVLDDNDDEDRKFLVNIEASKWHFALGDFPLAIEGSKFALFDKEVRGVLAEGFFHNKIKSTFLYAQSKGNSRREQFRGMGQTQEYKTMFSPVVQESEKVYIDGVMLVRGSDYQVDYDEGIVKMLPDVLPIEATRWVVIEYESDDESVAFTRNLFGTRQEYIRREDQRIGVTWLREMDNNSPKSGAEVDTASGTISPIQHDIYEADINWAIGKGFKLRGEYALSQYDPNRKSNETEEDKTITGHAASIALEGKNSKIDAKVSYDRVDSKFKTIGRDEGVVELGERGLVDDISSFKGDATYSFDKEWKGFVDGEKSKTNLDNNPAESKIDFKEFRAGVIWERDADNRFEIRGGRMSDYEYGPDIASDLIKDSSSAVYDRKFGKIKTQAKAERISYKDDLNVASDTETVELDLNLSGEPNEKLSWAAGVSRINVKDKIVNDQLRSETSNYTLQLSYEPSDKLTMRGDFQFRREDDNYLNSRSDEKIADSQITYEPNDDFKTTFKYKVENTSKVLKDETLDRDKYKKTGILADDDDDNILVTYESPVEKITINSTTDYRISRNLSAYVDWRRRDIDSKETGKNVSKNDRQTYELRYTPIEKMMLTTEFENGYSCNNDSVSELRDWLKSIQLRHEFKRGYILDATYEETKEDDTYDNTQDEYKKSKILELQRPINKKVTLEFGLQHNDIESVNPSTEFEKRLAVILTPSSRNQRYKFYASHKDIDAEINGYYYEGGVIFSQFIGTDTMIDGELKKIHSSKTINGDGYDSVVANAKVVISF